MKPHTIYRVSLVLVTAVLFLLLAGCAEKPAEDMKIPITTVSSQARDLYLESRDLTEKLRLADARLLAQESIKKDEDFALGHLMAARTASTAGEFYDALQKAVLLSEKVTDGERSIILGYAAGIKGDLEGQRGHYELLVEKYPEDERAHNLLGLYHFGRQEWLPAIKHYKKANEINPDFSAPYNQLGYALRFIGRYVEAEEAFKHYVELIPDEPNPYDSYAELLMKLGRFDESISNYEAALAKDPDFVASFIGIANNQMFMGLCTEARETLARLEEIATNDGQRRQAKFWTMVSYLHEAKYDDALATVAERYAIAEDTDDKASMSADMIIMGDILVESGRYDEAMKKYDMAVKVGDMADSLEEVKEATRRNILYNKGRAAIAKDDLKTAGEIVLRYGGLVTLHGIPAEVRRHNELKGLIALERKEYAEAVTLLEQANQQDPRVLYNMALACQGNGDTDKARELADQAANWNALAINFAYVKEAARELHGIL